MEGNVLLSELSGHQCKVITGQPYEQTSVYLIKSQSKEALRTTICSSVDKSVSHVATQKGIHSSRPLNSKLLNIIAESGPIGRLFLPIRPFIVIMNHSQFN